MLKTALSYFLASVPEIHYHGWEVVGFWYRQIADRYFTFSWQVRTAYFILLFTVVTILFLSILFSGKIRRRNRMEKMYEKCNERFREPFTKILSSQYHSSVMGIEQICGCPVDDFREFDGDTYSRLLCSIRLSMNDRVYIPSMQILAELTGVRDTVEYNLVHGKNVMQSLQLITTLPMRVSEGRLATYINHHDDRTRYMARQCLGICTESDPFRYLVEDLNAKVPPYSYLSFHRLFGWLSVTGRQMPSFLTTAERLDNEKSAAFMIEEIAHWGNEMEKNSISRFFYSDKIACRIAAVKVVAILKDVSKEEELVKMYQIQPEDVRMEILRTVRALGTGRQADFFEKAYLTAPTKSLAELALSCLYRYGNEGKQRFEVLRQTPMDSRSRNLLEQIESAGNLDLLRATAK